MAPSPWDHEAVTTSDVMERISVDPAICGGRPCVRGHRIWVSLVLGMLADGMTVPDLLEEYPGLQEPDVRACMAYGSLLAAGRFLDVP